MLSPESAVVEVIASMETGLLKYFYKELPLVWRVLSYNAMNKTYMINIGMANGFDTGTKFIASRYETIDEYKVSIPIGGFKINKLYGHNQSECTFRKGKREVEAVYLQSGKIVVP